MARPVHFELNVPDPKASVAFYETVFGWEFQQYGDQEYWLATTGPDGEPGINGAIQPAPDGKPATVNTVGVADLDATIQQVQDAGGAMAMDKMAIPGMGWVAYFTDPSGLVVGAFQEDSAAG